MGKGITKLKRILEGNDDESNFDAELYIQLYTYANFARISCLGFI